MGGMEVKTLYELREEHAAIRAVIDEAGAELEHELAAQLDRAVADLESDEADKMESFYRLIRHLEMEASAARAEAEQYAMMAKTRENAVKRIKDRIKDHLESTGRKSIETTSGKKFAIQANGGKQSLKLADTIDLDAVPAELVRVVRTLDTDAVRDAIGAGQAFDWATLEPRGTHLRIK